MAENCWTHSNGWWKFWIINPISEEMRKWIGTHTKTEALFLSVSLENRKVPERFPTTFDLVSRLYSRHICLELHSCLPCFKCNSPCRKARASASEHMILFLLWPRLMIQSLRTNIFSTKEEKLTIFDTRRWTFWHFKKTEDYIFFHLGHWGHFRTPTCRGSKSQFRPFWAIFAVGVWSQTQHLERLTGKVGLVISLQNQVALPFSLFFV